MALAQLTGVCLAYGGRDLLKAVNFGLDPTSRVALAGANGSGKTTLMRIIAGELRADSGEVAIPRDFRVGYLPQSGVAYTGRSLIEEAETAFDRLHALVARKEELELRLGSVTEASRETEQLLRQHHELQEALLDSGYYERRERIQTVLAGLGFLAADLERSAGDFSGGWQMRIALAKLLLGRPDLLLLDEPTNYLDLEARTWLEGYLTGLAGGYLIASHDRYFLDVTVDQVAELWNGRLKVYRGNYSSYEKRRGEELAEIVARYRAQREEIARTEEFINRFRYNASKAQMVQSRIKQLERIERIEIPETMQQVRFSFPPAPHSGRQTLSLEHVSKSYGSRRVLSDFSLSLGRGEKLVIAGRNGAGKSTLMRIVAGIDRSYSGSVRYGTDVELGYFSQDFEAHLDASKSVMEEIETVLPTVLYPRARDLLGAFLFRGDDVFKPVSVLSGGEKSRLALLKLLLVPANLLVLDEPTNHLDLSSKDVLLDALLRYEGTLVFVSHDRYFIEKLATQVLELTRAEAKDDSPSSARLFPGDYAYYLWKISGRSEESAAQGAGPKAAPGQPARPPSVLRKLEREQRGLLERIGELERRAAALSEELAKPSTYLDAERAKRVASDLDANAREQESATRRWEALEEELSAAKRR